MRIASAGKRFRGDMSWQREHAIAANLPDFKMTAGQARYMWLLVDLYRRQIKDEQLRSHGAHVKLTGELPPIYLEGDHRELLRKPKKESRARGVGSVPAAASAVAAEWPTYQASLF